MRFEILYSAIADLTFSDLYGHFSIGNFCLYLPEALINKLKHGTNKGLVETNNLIFI